MPRGRPPASDIRQNIVEILFYLKRGYGYQIDYIYRQVYPPCTREVIYYHLRKGVDLGLFKVAEVAVEKGDYSWGPDVQKIYYILGAEAQPRGNPRVEMAVAAVHAKNK